MAAAENRIVNPTVVPMSGVTLPMQGFRIGGQDFVKCEAGYDAMNLDTGAVVSISPATMVELIEIYFATKA